MPKKSAGILFFRFQNDRLEVLLVHPGGPYWSGKDDGVWSIPKGEINLNEDLLAAAKREVREELGIEAEGSPIQLNPVKQKSGKLVYCWAMKQDVDVTKIQSNQFELEWPPRSGQKKEFPEIDKAEWFDITTASRKLLPGQISFIEQLATLV